MFVLREGILGKACHSFKSEKWDSLRKPELLGVLRGHQRIFKSRKPKFSIDKRKKIFSSKYFADFEVDIKKMMSISYVAATDAILKTDIVFY